MRKDVLRLAERNGRFGLIYEAWMLAAPSSTWTWMFISNTSNHRVLGHSPLFLVQLSLEQLLYSKNQPTMRIKCALITIASQFCTFVIRKERLHLPFPRIIEFVKYTPDRLVTVNVPLRIKLSIGNFCLWRKSNTNPLNLENLPVRVLLKFSFAYLFIDSRPHEVDASKYFINQQHKLSIRCFKCETAYIYPFFKNFPLGTFSSPLFTSTSALPQGILD